MASLKEIKGRIGSVKNTLKITSAMKMISSAKLRKAQTAIENMLPYQHMLQEILLSLHPESVSAVCKSVHDDAVPAIVAISSNSSLCGSFNANVIRDALALLTDRPGARVFAVGRKMAESLRRAGYDCGTDLSDLIDSPTYEASADLADKLGSLYESGEVSEVILVYNHFVTAASQKVVRECFLPFDTASFAVSESDRDEDERYILEPDRDQLLAELLPKVIRLKLHTVLLDSSAAEHAARTVAMQTATDNGEDLLQQLSLEYNKGRQQKITSEILDLVGGSLQ